MNLCIKDYRFNHLNYCDGNVGRRAARLGNGAVIRGVGAALENAYVALTSVKNDLLFKYRYTLKFLRASSAETSLKYKLDIKFDSYGIKSSVEFYRLYTDVCP